MKTLSDFKLVMVKWRDSRNPIVGWNYYQDIDLDKLQPVFCISVGYLLKNKDGVVVIGSNAGDCHDADNLQFNGIIVIDKKSVITIEDLH